VCVKDYSLLLYLEGAKNEENEDKKERIVSQKKTQQHDPFEKKNIIKMEY
jgi:hypothetical protein